MGGLLRIITQLIALPLVLFIAIYLVAVMPNSIGKTFSNGYYWLNQKLFGAEILSIDLMDKSGNPINQEKKGDVIQSAYYKDNGIYHKDLTPWEQASNFLSVSNGVVKDGLEYNQFTEANIERGIQAILSGNPKELALVSKHMQAAKTDKLMTITPDGGARGIQLIDGQLTQFNINPDELERVVSEEVAKQSSK